MHHNMFAKMVVDLIRNDFAESSFHRNLWKELRSFDSVCYSRKDFYDKRLATTNSRIAFLEYFLSHKSKHLNRIREYIKNNLILQKYLQRQQEEKLQIKQNKLNSPKTFLAINRCLKKGIHISLEKYKENITAAQSMNSAVLATKDLISNIDAPKSLEVLNSSLMPDWATHVIYYK